MIIEKRIPLGYILSKIIRDLIIALVFSSFAFVITRFVLNFTLPATIAAFLGTAISLLISFKLAQSYDRWWEARKVWGAIVNDSRTLVLQLLNLHTGEKSENHQQIIKRIAYRQMGWCYALGRRLRKLNTTQDLDAFFEKEEFGKLKLQTHVPLAIIDMSMKEVLKLHQSNSINDFQQIQIDRTFAQLVSAMGQAERIKNTVFPKTYRIFLRFFIYVFLFILAFSITDLAFYLQIPLMIIISTPLFLLEKSAYHMQDPFENRPTDTSMTAIARTIEISIRQLLGEKELPEPLAPEGFYLN